jgi:hypothetical protein
VILVLAIPTTVPSSIGRRRAETSPPASPCAASIVVSAGARLFRAGEPAPSNRPTLAR